MSISLNHTIVWARDKRTSARFLADLLGLSVGADSGPFVPVQLNNDITLDYADTGSPISAQHYAFALDDAEFDAAFARIEGAGVTYYADPHHKQPGKINHMNGGRGLYFHDPDGHNMEILTRP